MEINTWLHIENFWISLQPGMLSFSKLLHLCSQDIVNFIDFFKKQINLVVLEHSESLVSKQKFPVYTMLWSQKWLDNVSSRWHNRKTDILVRIFTWCKTHRVTMHNESFILGKPQGYDKKIKAVSTLLPHIPFLFSSSCKTMKLIAATILT